MKREENEWDKYCCKTSSIWDIDSLKIWFWSKNCCFSAPNEDLASSASSVFIVKRFFMDVFFSGVNSLFLSCINIRDRGQNSSDLLTFWEVSQPDSPKWTRKGFCKLYSILVFQLMIRTKEKLEQASAFQNHRNSMLLRFNLEIREEWRKHWSGGIIFCF